MKLLCMYVFGILSFATCTLTSRAVPWRERKEYPENYDDFEVYVTSLSVTGERALNAGCGKNGRPYKYRGKNHAAKLRRVLQGMTNQVWVGAVDTTTPWKWSNGCHLYQFLGVTTYHRDTVNAVRISGNNVFLCSLQCQQVAFVLLQGNKCACSKTLPETVPVQPGNVLRCLGTYDDFCGTASNYTVYRNMLSAGFRWASLVERSQYHGTSAYLYRSVKADDQQDSTALLLAAEVDLASERGYICNGSVLNLGAEHIKHLWAEHPESSKLTWRNAQKACMNKRRQLLTISRSVAKTCIEELKNEMKEGRSYWLGLSRQNVSLWLDGTAVKTAVSYHQHAQSACLAMTFAGSGPGFSFESCTGLRLHVLCEKDFDSHQRKFIHDAKGNHVITGNSVSSEEKEYSSTVAILIGALVVLTLLSFVLMVFLCNRNKWMPHKPPPPRRRGHIGPAESWNTEVEWDIQRTSQRLSKEQKPNDLKQLEPFTPDSTGYAVVNKACRQARPLSASDKPRATSAPVDYAEVSGFYEDAPEEQKRHVSVDNGLASRGHELRKGQGLSSVKMLGCRLDSSHSSLTGSADDTYSVLNYRHAIQKAWVDLKRTAAYAHVMVHKPSKEGTVQESTETDDAIVYDVARLAVMSRVRCIDNDYDHAEPRVEKSQLYSEDGTYILLTHSDKCNESEV